ncbi:P-type DNA transfer ATPase VirB11 [Anaeromyxobacter paludicola]|uniref:P-type DNA transfer ATPase VirB11 n=1 Tax=Anaeromyxobacter paludicola TaxID=2918171 RepID=UPI0020BE3988|nr:P-type DNA transfer ATPase VirB11 [Anaeromyxobacter paludicola]
MTELAVNRPGELWLRTFAGWAREEAPALTAAHLDALTTGMAVYSGLALRSLASVVLPGGERGQIVREPACVRGFTPLTIRKHLQAVRTLEELEGEGAFEGARDVSFHRPSKEEARAAADRQDAGRIEPVDVELLALKREGKLAAFLQRAVLARRNVVIAGKTGSGKTTLARSLVAEVPAHERIVTIEDVHELALPCHPNRVHLMYGEGPGRVTAEACLAACMRLSPDRIFLAELRGSEAWEYVQGLNTGHPGSVTTTHANGAVQAFDRIAGLVKSSEVGRGLEVAEIRRVLHATLDVVLFMSERRVTEVYFDPIFARREG